MRVPTYLAAALLAAAVAGPAAADPPAGVELAPGPGVCVWWDVSPHGPVIAGTVCVP